MTVQPGPPQGGAGAVSSVFTRVGAVVAQAGDYTAALVTNAADKSSGSQQLFTAEVAAPDLNAIGVPGAPQQARLRGGTASGAPVSGTHALNDIVADQTGKLWLCTAAGTPGTWTQIGAGGGTNGTAALGADVANATANTFADGPNTGAIGAAGQVFLILADIVWNCGASMARYTYRIWDGTTTYNEGFQAIVAAASFIQGHLHAIVTLAGAATFKISGAPDSATAGAVIKAAASFNSGGNLATRISYVRLA